MNGKRVGLLGEGGGSGWWWGWWWWWSGDGGEGQDKWSTLPQNLVKTEITEKIIVIKLMAVIIS